MSIKNKMQILKKELLLEEASKAFEAVGYEQMKIVDLAKKAQVSAGTIYTLFNSKEGLYLAYLEHQMNHFYEELLSRSQAETPQKNIYLFIHLKFSYYQQKRKAIEQSAADNPFFFNTLYKEHTVVIEKIYLFLSETFMQLNPKLDEAAAMRLAFGLNGFSDGYISQWLELNDNLLDRTDEVSELFLTMITGCCR